MTTIFLYGHLRDLHPEPISVEANSAAEALTSLQLIPALAWKGGPRHRVRVDGFASADALYDKRQVKELHVYPVTDDDLKHMVGSGRAGVTQIVIGALMITAAFFTMGTSLAFLAPGLFISGGMMALGGILQMLSPQPKLGGDDKSRYLGQGRNTVAIGTRIPLVYGRCKAYGQYISFNIDSGKFDGAPEAWYSSPYTNYGSDTYSASLPDIPMENPQGLDQNPVSAFRGIAYPDTMTSDVTTYITFDATVLLAGPYDLNFANGKTLHVENETAGTTSRVVLRGGEVLDMPPVGTNIVFTRNYG